MRAAVDLEELGPTALNVDCDVLNADGGTRCAATAGNIALRLAVRRLIATAHVPVDLRLTEDQKKEGVAPATMTDEEKKSHESRVLPRISSRFRWSIDGEV